MRPRSPCPAAAGFLLLHSVEIPDAVDCIYPPNIPRSRESLALGGGVGRWHRTKGRAGKDVQCDGKFK